MKLSLTNVLELADATKANFDARRARGLLSFFPFDAGAAAELDPLTPGISVHNPTPAIGDANARSRHRYSIADAVAIDLFERANKHSRIDNEILDKAIANSAAFIVDSVIGDGRLRHGYGQPDRFIGVALYHPDGRWHFAGGTLAEIAASLIKSHDPKRGTCAVSEIVLLNVSTAIARISSRYPLVLAGDAK